MGEIELITGTTVGVRATDGVVLAAEKRVSYGFYMMSRSGKKVFKIDTNLGVASAGILADMQIVSRILRTYLNLYTLDTKTRPKVRSAAKLLSILLFQSRILPYICELLVGGVDDEGPHLFVLDPLGSLIDDDYASLGTGAKIAIGVLESLYRKDINVGEARELAVKAINQAISRDPVSGDGCDLMVITKDSAIEETITLKTLRI